MGAWNEKEVELIVADYFDMLSLELSGQAFKKSEHRKDLLPLLNNRSESSIEFKHQNISAVLINFGLPYIKGYLPRFNFQRSLEEAIGSYLEVHKAKLEERFWTFIDREIVEVLERYDYSKLLVSPPTVKMEVHEQTMAYNMNPIKINFLEREQRNRSLGLLGEELVLNYERWNLINSGKEKLAEQIRWVSKEEGDGAGYDILSRNLDGTDKFIEVKATRLGKETPFFFTRNELMFSIEKKQNYHLYRPFNFGAEPKIFTKTGGLDEICTSIPVTFKGYF